MPHDSKSYRSRTSTLAEKKERTDQRAEVLEALKRRFSDPADKSQLVALTYERGKSGPTYTLAVGSGFDTTRFDTLFPNLEYYELNENRQLMPLIYIDTVQPSYLRFSARDLDQELSLVQGRPSGGKHRV